MRFRKRIKLAKGLRVNVSKSGLSLNAGIPGLSVNFGKKGAYLNTGVPGTGLYDRKRISLPEKQPRPSSRNGSPNSAASASPSHSETSSPEKESAESKDESSLLNGSSIQISLDKRGKPVLFDADGQSINDAALMTRLKRKEEFREQVKMLSLQVYQDYQEELSGWLNIFRQAPDLIPRASWEDRLAQLEPGVYKKQPFAEPEPSEEAARKELLIQAEREIRTLAFWRRGKLRRKFVEESLPGEVQKRRDAWQQALEAHERQEEERRKSFDREEKERIENERMHLSLTIEGNPTFIEPIIEEELKKIRTPFIFYVDLDMTADGKTIGIDLDLPEIEETPDRNMRINSWGKLSVRRMTDTDRRKNYLSAVSGLMISLAATVLNVSPNIEDVVISGYTQRIDQSTGRQKDVYILSVDYDRTTMEQLVLQRIDPTAALQNFHCRTAFTKRWIPREIEPLEITPTLDGFDG